jgi:8-oxo-dGTP pyrophosphatase MutT (NUDIX family)
MREGGIDTLDVERQALRAILLTPDEEILLIRLCPPEGAAPFWIAPGGGLEAGETSETGLRRELWEELGLGAFEIGPMVWRRQHTFNWAGKRICQREQYYIVRVDRFQPVIRDEVEAKIIDRFQWWRITDLEHSQERLTPISLAAIVHRYITEGPSQGPLPVEVIVD